MTLETEVKLRADEAALAALAVIPALGPAHVGPARTVRELDVYLDTADGRLAAARWACRLRSRERRRWISLKGPAEHTAGDLVHRRLEVEGPVPAAAAEDPTAWPDSPARDLVLRLAGTVRLGERLSLQQERTERPVLVDGQRVGTLSLDHVRVLHAEKEVGTMRVVELEMAPATASGLVVELAAALVAQPGLEPDPTSKLERALEMAEGAAEATA